MTRLWLIFMLFLSLLQARAAFAVDYSLEELFKLGLEHSERIRFIEEDQYIAELNRDKAVSVLYPRLSAFGEMRRYSEEKTTQSGQSLQPETTSSWGLRLEQSLSISGRELTALKVSKGRIEKSQHDINAVKEGYLFNVASAYYEVLKARKALEIARTNFERLKSHKGAVETRLKVGEVTKTALLRAEAELSGAESLLISAENRISVSRADLSRLIGITHDFGLKEPLPGDSDWIFNTPLNSLKEIAFNERQELKALEKEKRNLEAQLRYVKDAYWPTLSLEGVYSNKDDSPSSSSAVKESLYAGIKVVFSIFDGGLKAADMREAQARLRQAGLSLEDYKKSVAVEVENAYLRFLTDSSIIKSMEDRMSFAQDNYNAVSKQFEHGLSTSMDVMDANTLLITAEMELSEAVFNRKLSVIRLNRATGTLLKGVNPPQ